MLAIGGAAFKFLNGRITRCEDKNSEVFTKVFDKLDTQNREIGEVKVGLKAATETMKEGFKRIGRKIDNGNKH